MNERSSLLLGQNDYDETHIDSFDDIIIDDIH